MIAYRETIIKSVLKSTDKFEVSIVISNAIHKMSENGTHPFIVLRFIDKLRTSLTGIKSMSVSERNNIAQALQVLESNDIKNTMNARVSEK